MIALAIGVIQVSWVQIPSGPYKSTQRTTLLKPFSIHLHGKIQPKTKARYIKIL